MSWIVVAYPNPISACAAHALIQQLHEHEWRNPGAPATHIYRSHLERIYLLLDQYHFHNVCSWGDAPKDHHPSGEAPTRR